MTEENMIEIKDEEIQKEYGFTNGCVGCGTRDFKKDIKEINFFQNRRSGIVILLCKNCRESLKSIL